MKEYKDRKLLYVHDGRVYIDSEGRIYGSPNDVIVALKKRYEYLAPNIKFVQRAIPLKEEDRKKYVEFKSIGISVIPLPDLSSLKGMLIKSRKAKRILKKAISESDIIILRNSKNTAYAQPIAEHLKKPYIFEVVSCNWDALWNYSFKGKLYAPYAYMRMKYNVAKAKYVIYVTKEFLQRRYPNKHNNSGISDVMINPIDKKALDRKIEYYKNSKHIILSTCAAIDVRYKGQEYIIRAVAMLKDKYDIKYHLAGGGDKSYLQRVAEECGVSDRIIFEGLLSKSDVNKLLDSTTIYCQPSKQEGLPRAVVEAMSRGCVCIGTKTGGIPELLDSSMLANNGDVKKLALLIDTILQNRDIAIQQARKNFAKSKEFIVEVLDKKRCEFYEQFISEN